MRRITLLLAALLAVCLVGVATPGRAARMILNEYNAVRDAMFLKDGASDPYFGRVAGNGGDWMEFVVIEDLLDVRGWSFVTTQNGQPDATIVLPDVPVLSSLRSGTILTIAELVGTDWSYDPVYDPTDPSAGDWWINYQASFSEGDNTHSNFQVTILDASGAVVFGPAGEGINPVSGIGNDEVFKLEEDPSPFITPFSNYRDGSSSTFGLPNRWSGGTMVQDFGPLRSVVPEPSSLLALSLGLAGILGRRRFR